ncbi:MAG: diphthine synthase [Thermoplasmata archaeon]|nr:diphthine synthase [Thermoplasmata archaeon]
MAELWFVGMGLGDERDLSLRAMDVLRGLDAVFAEEYTSLLAPGSLERLSTSIGKPVTRLGRESVEDAGAVLTALDTHPDGRVGFLVAGDPFGATTHVALRLAAEERGHRWRYLPNASILTTAASYLGLMHYRFGRTVSLPFPEPNFQPRSPMDLLGRNFEQGLHTLVLLDLRPSESRFLSAGDALQILGGTSEAPGVPGDRLVAVVARLGTDQARAWVGPRRELEGMDFGAPLHAVVVPGGELHFEEEAALARFRRG